MRWNCRYPGEVICIKSGKYGAVYVPAEEKRAKETKKPAGDNALDGLKEDIARIRDEMIKKNRDDLDAMYNIDMDNMSTSMKSLFASWTDGVSSALASVETIANSQEAVVKLVAQYDESIASIEAKANANAASITSIVQWQSDVDDSIKSTAEIQQEVSENTASIKQIVEVVGEDGEALTASVTTAILNDESFIELVADRVTISGTAEFVTRDELSDDAGSTVISGNLISLIMDGDADTATGYLNSTSLLVFDYKRTGKVNETMAEIKTKVGGSTSEIASRYALELRTYEFTTSYGTTVYPAIKLIGLGGISLDADDDTLFMTGYTARMEGIDSLTLYAENAMYAECLSGYITLDAQSDTRIRANMNYSGASALDTPASNDYVFATDGIYYNGTKILST